MRILTMTATFGKLRQATLTLEPGLNVIEAPNEWGKSTWCAFLTDMLYGVDTGARSTKTALADKERYAPWTGEPMSGSMTLLWQGRKITIQRRSKGRMVFGVFQAFETDSGLPVPELTGENCGQTLLGVERSVFVRAGFLRLTDLPVTQDESLRRRLNALVTTGDESDAADRLAQSLKDLKNKCRFNKSGLLPQAEAQRRELEETLAQLSALRSRSQLLEARRKNLEEHIGRLENHRAALAWEASQADAHRVEAAQAAAEAAEGRLAELARGCEGLPPQAAAEAALQTLSRLQDAQSALEMEAALLPERPERPEIPPAYLSGDVEGDAESYRALKNGSLTRYWVLLIAGLALGAALAVFLPWYFGLVPPALALAIFLVKWNISQKNRREAEILEEKYGTSDTDAWLRQAQAYGQAQARYEAAQAAYDRAKGTLDDHRETLRRNIEAACGGQSLRESQTRWETVRDAWSACADARREAQRAKAHAGTVVAMARPAPPPNAADDLTFSEAETARLLSDSLQEQRQLQRELGQLSGRMEALGQEDALRQKLDGVQERIRALEQTYAALTMAQEALTEARTALQRRFAPPIVQRAREIFSTLTGGRYDRLTLEQDFLVQTGTAQEDTLRTTLWRSDGTVDQLYFALRLAVAEALTPSAPLILDDALARFDDKRLAAALALLQQAAGDKQVLLFTCQGREAATVGAAQRN